MKKTIFIVGAGKGLGNAIGRKFGENDFRVVLMSRNNDSLNSYAEEFKAKGIEV
ncbi:MAG: SDR family NAD(P)-dependent oxidoreductase [Clostridium sp.]|nr:SDR family NAD(P)-dependent oxidoreductase [Clostridium sp.]